MIRGGVDSAKSSLFSQQSNPVRSSKGGYLRCPFEINSQFAELAARHVEASTLNKSKTKASITSNTYFDKYVKETRNGDANNDLRKSRNYGSNGGESDEEDGNDVDRPWTRAGVGARSLNAREKRAQQEQAELVYGNGETSQNKSKLLKNNIKNSNNDRTSATSHSASTIEKHDIPLKASATSMHNAKGKELFATDMKDQVALHKVLPRKMRYKMHKSEESMPEKSTHGNQENNNCRYKNTSCNSNEDADNNYCYNEDDDEISKTETVANKLCIASCTNVAKNDSTSVEENHEALEQNKKKKRKKKGKNQSRSSGIITCESVLGRNESHNTEIEAHSAETDEIERGANLSNPKKDCEQHTRLTSEKHQLTHQHSKLRNADISPALNRVQQLDALRNQALFGSKRRRQQQEQEQEIKERNEHFAKHMFLN